MTGSEHRKHGVLNVNAQRPWHLVRRRTPRVIGPQELSHEVLRSQTLFPHVKVGPPLALVKLPHFPWIWTST